MLSFNVRELEREAISVDGLLDADDPVWLEGDARPAGAVHATGRLSKAGQARYYWSGRIEGTSGSTCRRCLASVSDRVSEEVHVFFVDADDEVATDPDTFRLPARADVVDLRPAIREQWLLGAPEFTLCREDCRGLCARCGADLNTGDCSCLPETDRRWAALRATREPAP